MLINNFNLEKNRKLVLVLATFVKLIKISNKMILENILYIYYLVQFRKKDEKVFINLNNEVNIKTFAYRAKLKIKICYTNIKVCKIVDSIFEIF